MLRQNLSILLLDQDFAVVPAAGVVDPEPTVAEEDELAVGDAGIEVSLPGGSGLDLVGAFDGERRVDVAWLCGAGHGVVYLPGM
ncbi:hypothetical protein [Rugosimonospora africana]|uniref:hypothetical protein n=1 Tax=Rugosimonospora africana TaxID=556532 RepID=UPI001EF17187|nr:hypothetical protein [Rugosimonospora africana]